ncbi:MAG: succinate dehydrogenase, hydrophobic membrane anchor protein [Arenicella sp.]|nr:succinate dehydrogenase, hydrophobic membrane anchor protein [Arenicella sp.]
MSLRSPLSKAVGLGSAKHGFSHWWWQRVTAIALIPLTLWFAFSVIGLIGADHARVMAWLGSPINATIVLLFVLTALYHGQTGVQVVIEDYIHTTWLNLTLLLFVKFASVIMAVLAIISVLKVVLGG